MIKAIVFDIDGTLLDTREYIQLAYEHALTSHGHVVPSREALVEMIRTGGTLEKCYSVFAPNGDVIALRDAHRTFQNDNLELITAYKGLIEFLKDLHARGIKLGACSSRGAAVRPSLEKMHALSYFELVLDSFDVTHHKPHPEGVLKVLAHMKIPPSEAAMIGDTIADIQAGKNAGVQMTIGVTHGFGTRESLQQAGADFIVESLPEILPLVSHRD